MKIILLLIIIIPFTSFAQILGGGEIDIANLTAWETSKLSDYEGIYSFGFSEAESEINISIDGNLVCVQLEAGDWILEDGEAVGWRVDYINYTNVRIEGNKFFSSETNGEFIIYKKGNRNIKCLKIDVPPIQTGETNQYEIGAHSEGDYSGKYIKTKFEILKEDYLEGLSLRELGIMRNEIFARYGYIFRAGGKMATYFKKQAWYSGVNENVQSYLTDIEKINIRSIRKIEQIKKSK
jgi:hypothetical protein